MNHPSAIELEALACGETPTDVLAHVEGCDACGAFVARARGVAEAAPLRSPAVVVAAARRKGGSARMGFVASVVAPLAVAAGVALVIAGRPPPSSPPAVRPPERLLIGHLGEAASSRAEAPPAAEPETTFKGGFQVAVVRERAGKQERFTSDTHVRSGDRLRLEVALDRTQTILGAVVGDDGSFLELMTEGSRTAGTHFSEKSARVDEAPTRGTILVGPPDAVRRARETGRFDGVRTLRIEPETP